MLMPAATKMGGNVLAVPDVCKTPAPPAPPIPIPYPNLGLLNSADPVTVKVKFLNQPVLHKQSKIPTSAGDEAGSAGGVISSMIKGPIKFIKASESVKVEGQFVLYLTCQSQHNGSNANAPQGAIISPSQSVVLVAM